MKTRIYAAPAVKGLRAGARCSGWSCLIWKSEIAGSTPAQAIKFQRNKMFPRSLVKMQYCGEPPWPGGSVLPQTARTRISNPVSGGQCHLIHLTILRRFSLPTLAYMCTKVIQNPINVILFHFVCFNTTSVSVRFYFYFVVNCCRDFQLKESNYVVWNNNWASHQAD